MTDRFDFEGWDVDGRVVALRYAVAGGPRFEERLSFPTPLPATAAVEGALRLVHLVAGVSYYKCIAPAPMTVPWAGLDPTESALVDKLYDDGLRELAVENDLDLPLPVTIEERGPAGTAAAGTTPSATLPPAGGAGGAVVPIGGGKDSALVATLLPEAVLLAVNPRPGHRAVADHLGRALAVIDRVLSPTLRELVAAGVQNGHVPVTAVNGSLAVLFAAATGAGEVAMGLERSADEATRLVGGVPVNHQYSKSLEAELLLRQAAAPTGVSYFSPLRPFSELAISRACIDRGLVGATLSCNRQYRLWDPDGGGERACGECAKCLFTALMYATGMERRALAEAIGFDAFGDPALVAGFADLWDDDRKPFECVGEKDEAATAMAWLGTRPGWQDAPVVQALAPAAAAVVGGPVEERLRAYLQPDPAGRQHVPDGRSELVEAVARSASVVAPA